MTTKQNDTVALTDDHLDAVVGGAAYIKMPGPVEESIPSAVTLVGSKSRARSR